MSEHSRPSRLLIVSLTALAFLGALDHTIVATTLPAIAGDLGAVANMGWIIVGYTLASTVTMPLFGWAADRFDARTVLFASTGVFLTGSLLCGFAWDLWSMTAARVIQGIGSAGMHLLPQTIIGQTVPPRQRAALMSIVGIAFPVAIVVGPVAGGVIADTVGWPWVFWVNIPLGLAALALATKGIAPITPMGRRGFDLAGTLATAAFTLSLVLAVTWGAGARGWRDPWTLDAVAAGVLAAAILVPVERRAASPVFPLGLLRHRTVAMATVLSIVVGVGLFAVVQYVPTYVQMVHGVSASVSGVVPMAMIMGMLVGTLTSGAIVSRTGAYRWAAVGGTVVGAAGMVAMAVLPLSFGVAGPAVVMGLVGVSVGSFMQLVVVIAQAGAPRSAIGTVTAVVNLTRQIASTVATALVGAWIGTRVTAGLPAELDAGQLTPEAVRGSSDAAQAAVSQLYLEALVPVFLVLAGVFVCGIVAAVALPASALRDHPAGAGVDTAGDDPTGDDSAGDDSAGDGHEERVAHRVTGP